MEKLKGMWGLVLLFSVLVIPNAFPHADPPVMKLTMYPDMPAVDEEVKIRIGSAYPLPEEKTMTVRGRNLVSGLPETLELSSVEVREAMSGSVQTILDTIKDSLDEVAPEIVSDLMDVGICMSGGGSLLQGLANRVTDEVRIRAWVAEDPMTCVARGAGLILEDFENLKHWLLRVDSR